LPADEPKSSSLLGSEQMKTIVSLIFMFIATITFAENKFDHSHKYFDQVLKKYLNKNFLVKYQVLKKDSTDPNHIFPKYLKSLSAVSKQTFNSWNKNQKMAFLINSYNAFTLKLIVDHYPVKSIKDIGSLFTKPWDIKFFTFLDNKEMSLDPIEHQMLRPVFKDPRIHAAVNCASISCPKLARTAFTAQNLELLLETQTKEWINDTTRNKAEGSGKWQLSKIFDWYEEDFVQWGKGVTEFVAKYHDGLNSRVGSKKVDIDYLEYNWQLNDAKKNPS
tara:strand:- start:232 stop:1059 length:828 start_codon:yes stop_codon:yes gene_type:complete